MSNEAEVRVPKRGRGCLFWIAVLLFGLPIGIIGVAVLLFGWRDMAAQRKFEQRVSSLRSQGLPVDADSLRAYHEQLTYEESLSEWLAVLKILSGSEYAVDCKELPIVGAGSEPPFPVHGQAWGEEAEVRQFLEKHRGLHDRLMRLCLDAKPVRFPVEWQGTGTLLENTQQMRSAVRLLSLRGQLALFDRDAAAVRRAVDASLGCAVTLEGEPTLVSQLVAMAIRQIALSTLKSGVEQDILRPDDLRYLITKLLPRTNLGDQWKIAINGERAMMLPIYQDSSVAERELGGDGDFVSRLPFRGRDANTYLDIIEQATEVETSSLEAFISDTQDIDEQMESRLTGNIIQQLDNVITARLAPALGYFGQAFADEAIAMRLAVTAMAVRLHELESGSFPDSLSGLQIEDTSPKDVMPPGARPFGYELDDGNAYLWGFTLRMNESSVPVIRPIISDGEPNADFRRSAIWRLAPHAEDGDNVE